MTPTTEPRQSRPRPHRPGRGFVVAAVGVLVAVAVVAIATPHTPETTRSSPAADGAGEQTPVPTTSPDTTLGPQAPAVAPSLQPATGPRGSTEVGGAADESDAATAPPEVTALLSGDAPPSASDVGALVAGFPQAVPIVADSTIVSSSVDSSENTVHATVVARTPYSTDDVVAQYQSAFAALGLPGSPLPSAAGDRALAFSRDGSSVTLTVGPDGSGSTYSLFAVITLIP